MKQAERAKKAIERYEVGLLDEPEAIRDVVCALGDLKQTGPGGEVDNHYDFIRAILQVVRTAGIDFKEFAVMCNQAVNDL